MKVCHTSCCNRSNYQRTFNKNQAVTRTESWFELDALTEVLVKMFANFMEIDLVIVIIIVIVPRIIQQRIHR